MNEIVNKFLSAEDKFMAEMHLRQPGSHTMLVDHLQKKKKEYKNLKKREIHDIFQNEIDKTCFQHDMTYGDFEDLARRTASDKILHDKAIHITKNPKYDEYKRRLASMVYKFFDKKNFLLRY